MLGDAIASALPYLRGEAESRMRGTCLIDRLGATTTDDDGTVTRERDQVYPDPSWPEGHPHGAGKCYVRYPGVAFEASPTSAGVTIVNSRVIVRIPFGVVIRPGDRVQIAADPDNPQLAGAVYRVASIDDQSQATAQRLLCDDAQAGVITTDDPEADES